MYDLNTTTPTANASTNELLLSVDNRTITDILKERWPFLFLGLIIIGAVTMNAILIVSIAVYKKLHEVFYYAIASMSVGHILNMLLTVPFHLARTVLEDFPFPAVWCHTWEGLCTVFTAVNTVHLCVLALTCLVMFTNPLRYKMWNECKKIILTLLVCWIIPILLAVPSVIFRLRETTNNSSQPSQIYNCGLLETNYKYAQVIPSYALGVVIFISIYYRAIIGMKYQNVLAYKLKNSTKGGEKVPYKPVAVCNGETTLDEPTDENNSKDDQKNYEMCAKGDLSNGIANNTDGTKAVFNTDETDIIIHKQGDTLELESQSSSGIDSGRSSMLDEEEMVGNILDETSKQIQQETINSQLSDLVNENNQRERDETKPDSLSSGQNDNADNTDSTPTYATVNKKSKAQTAEEFDENKVDSAEEEKTDNDPPDSNAVATDNDPSDSNTVATDNDPSNSNTVATDNDPSNSNTVPTDNDPSNSNTVATNNANGSNENTSSKTEEARQNRPCCTTITVNGQAMDENENNTNENLEDLEEQSNKPNCPSNKYDSLPKIKDAVNNCEESTADSTSDEKTAALYNATENLKDDAEVRYAIQYDDDNNDVNPYARSIKPDLQNLKMAVSPEDKQESPEGIDINSSNPTQLNIVSPDQELPPPPPPTPNPPRGQKKCNDQSLNEETNDEQEDENANKENYNSNVEQVPSTTSPPPEENFNNNNNNNNSDNDQADEEAINLPDVPDSDPDTAPAEDQSSTPDNQQEVSSSQDINTNTQPQTNEATGDTSRKRDNNVENTESNKRIPMVRITTSIDSLSTENDSTDKSKLLAKNTYSYKIEQGFDNFTFQMDMEKPTPEFLEYTSPTSETGPPFFQTDTEANPSSSITGEGDKSNDSFPPPPSPLLADDSVPSDFSTQSDTVENSSKINTSDETVTSDVDPSVLPVDVSTLMSETSISTGPSSTKANENLDVSTATSEMDKLVEEETQKADQNSEQKITCEPNNKNAEEKTLHAIDTKECSIKPQRPSILKKKKATIKEPEIETVTDPTAGKSVTFAQNTKRGSGGNKKNGVVKRVPTGPTHRPVKSCNSKEGNDNTKHNIKIMEKNNNSEYMVQVNKIHGDRILKRIKENKGRLILLIFMYLFYLGMTAPYQVYYVYKAVGTQQQANPATENSFLYLLTIFQWVSISAAFVNPIMCWIFSSDFRTGYKECYLSCCDKEQKYYRQRQRQLKPVNNQSKDEKDDEKEDVTDKEDTNADNAVAATAEELP